MLIIKPWLFKWVDYACSGAVWGHFDFKLFQKKYSVPVQSFHKFPSNFQKLFSSYIQSLFIDTSAHKTGRTVNMVTLPGISIMNLHVYIVINKICILKIKNEFTYNKFMWWDDRENHEKDLLNIPENVKNYQGVLYLSWLQAMVLVHGLIPFFGSPRGIKHNNTNF